MRATGVSLFIRDFGHDSAFGSNSGEKQSETEVWGFRDKGFAGGETSWRRLPGEKPNWLRPSVPLMYEEAQGWESHLKSRIAMLGETFRPIQQRKTGGAILVVLLPSTGER